MADPVIAGGIRARLVFEHETGLPEDSAVWTYAFDRLTVPYADACDDIADRLQEFVDTAATPAEAVRTILGPQLTGAVTIQCYDLEDTPPRIPTEFEFTFTEPTGEGLPSEVAICNSVYSGVNTATTRGRQYIGPLHRDASAVGADGEPRPTTQARDNLTLASLRLASYAAPLWAILSGVDAALYPVTNGWVDDAFDTQRRRGPDPTTRSTWGLP